MGVIADMKAVEIPSAFASSFSYNAGAGGSLQDMQVDYNKMQVKKLVEVV